MERNSRKLIRLLEQDGWQLVRIRGDHHIFSHPERQGLVVVPHPKKDLGKGLTQRIYRDAGWRT